MLRRCLTALATIALALATVAVAATSAQAGGTCTIDPTTGTCTVTGNPPSHPPTTGPGHHGTGDITCSYQGQTIPCVKDGIYWDAAHHCYPKPAPDWANSGVEGVDPHTGETGGYYWCWPPGMYGPYVPIWIPGAPPKIDPAVVARQLAADVGMKAITIGIVPQARPGSRGLVGMPVWVWNAAAGDPHTRGPLTDADQGVSITATVGQFEVDWGDGSSSTCTTMTPYQRSDGVRSSPDCGHHYDSPGSYTVSVTNYWDIPWQGLGQRGILHADFTQTAQIQIGELQVLNSAS